jgi:MFS family permease
LSTLNLAIIGDLYDGDQRATAVGFNSSIHSIGAASYPIIGGALTTLGWFFPFFVSFFAIPVGIVILYSLHTPEPRTQRSFLAEIETTLSYFKNKQVAGLLLSAFFTFVLLYGGFLTYFPFVIESTLYLLPSAIAPVIIGIIIASRPLSTSLSSSQLGKVLKHRSVKQLVMGSFILIGIAFLLVSWISNVWLFLVPSIIYGVAMGIGIPSIQNNLIALVPLECRGQVTAAFGTAVRFGQTLGPILMGTVFGLWGLTNVFLIGVILSAVALVISSLLLPNSTLPERKTTNFVTHQDLE